MDILQKSQEREDDQQRAEGGEQRAEDFPRKIAEDFTIELLSIHPEKFCWEVATHVKDILGGVICERINRLDREIEEKSNELIALRGILESKPNTP